MSYIITNKANAWESFCAVIDDTDADKKASEIVTQLERTEKPVQVSLCNGFFINFPIETPKKSANEISGILKKELNIIDKSFYESTHGMVAAILHKDSYEEAAKHGLYKDWQPLETVVTQGADKVIEWLEKYVNSKVFREDPIYMEGLASFAFYSEEPWHNNGSPETQTLENLFAKENLHDFGMALINHFKVGTPQILLDKNEDLQNYKLNYRKSDLKDYVSLAKDRDSKKDNLTIGKPGATAENTSGKQVGAGEELTTGKGSR